ncbi:MAG: hypothetical protein ACNA7W_04405 [Pseudomonadales bacterium]
MSGAAAANRRTLLLRPRAWLWLAPALLYALFWFWYTPLGGPLTAAEIDHFIGKLEGAGDSERLSRLRRFMEEDSGRQFIMVNVIDMAEAPVELPATGPGASADDLMNHYMEHMYVELFKRASHPVFVGKAVFSAMDVVGIEGAEEWTRVGLMRYRSRRDLLEIASNPAFGARHDYKVAALDKTIAYPVEAELYLGDPRLLLALLLLAVVALTDVLTSRFSAARAKGISQGSLSVS